MTEVLSVIAIGVGLVASSARALDLITLPPLEGARVPQPVTVAQRLELHLEDLEKEPPHVSAVDGVFGNAANPHVDVVHGAVLRGDMDSITVGAGTNIQDNSTVHTDAGFPAVIGERVTVGHNAVVHGCRLGDGSLVGMGAVIQNGAVIGEQAVIAVGGVVRMYQESRAM